MVERKRSRMADASASASAASSDGGAAAPPAAWSFNEDVVLCEALCEHGWQRWSVIRRQHFPARTTASIRTRATLLRDVLKCYGHATDADVRPALERYHAEPDAARRAALHRFQHRSFAAAAPFGSPHDSVTPSPAMVSPAHYDSASGSSRESATSLPAAFAGTGLVRREAFEQSVASQVLSQATMDAAAACYGASQRAVVPQAVTPSRQTVTEQPQPRPTPSHGDFADEAAARLIRVAASQVERSPSAEAAVDTVMRLTDQYRPAGHRQLVALQLAQRHPAFAPRASESAFDEGAAPPALWPLLTEPTALGSAVRIEPPQANVPSGALRRRLEGAPTDMADVIRVHIRSQTSAFLDPVDVTAADASDGPGLRVGDGAVFQDAWANMEATGAIVNRPWTSVVEPTRCVLRSLMPFVLSVARVPLPCLYEASCGASAGGGFDPEAGWCPLSVFGTMRSAMARMGRVGVVTA
jgi:hypothetical protein